MIKMFIAIFSLIDIVHFTYLGTRVTHGDFEMSGSICKIYL